MVRVQLFDPPLWTLVVQKFEEGKGHIFPNQHYILNVQRSTWHCGQIINIFISHTNFLTLED